MNDQPTRKFPHLRPDEAKLLGMALQVARLHYSPTMPNGSPELWKRINKLFVRLQPWIAARENPPTKERREPGFDVAHINDIRFGGTLDETGE